jgi:hypothetical protein
MFASRLMLLTVVTAILAFPALPARAQDFELCFATADRVANGETLSEEDKQVGHAACQKALAATSSIMQKQQLQEADFDIIGRPPKPSN